MIKKTILAALVMLVAYHFSFPHLPRTYFQLSGPQRDNFFRAQTYVHKIPSETKLIVGSSLSLRLNQSILGQDYYKLAFGGGGIFTGLEIVRRSNHHPRVVLIEINQIGTDDDDVLLHDAFAPLRMTFRNKSPIFMEEGRPANFVNGIGELFLRKLCHGSSRLLGQAPAPDVPTASKDANPALFERLRRFYHDAVLASPPVNLPERTHRLGDYVDRLGSNGSVCVFYEMPFDSSLSDLPSPAAVRNAMETRFPKNKYHWLEFPRDHDYDTYDGVHVSRAEADRLTEVLVQQVKEIW